jgi:hypothetical protein
VPLRAVDRVGEALRHVDQLFREFIDIGHFLSSYKKSLFASVPTAFQEPKR